MNATDSTVNISNVSEEIDYKSKTNKKVSHQIQIDRMPDTFQIEVKLRKLKIQIAPNQDFFPNY